VEEKPELTAEVVLRFRGYIRVVLRENRDNYGLYFLNPAAPVPFLWFGMAWRSGDPPGTLPAWGASLEVNGDHVRAFEEGAGNLLKACDAAATDNEMIQLHRFEQHVELARWREFEWLLEQPDQTLALKRFWAGYLRALAAARLPAAVAAFTREAGIA
jgi:hypothetical protein